MAITKVINTDFPDPCVIWDGSAYHAWGTQTGATNLQHATSSDLETWSSINDALPTVPSWSNGVNLWAPEVIPIPTGYMMYYTAHHAWYNMESIGIALAATANDVFVPVASSGPLYTGQAHNGAIDGEPFFDSDGRSYLSFRTWGPTTAHIHLVRTRCKGLGTRGVPQVILTADQTWENGNVEAPSIVRRGANDYVMLYSGEAYDVAEYAIGYATASSVTGPWTKVTTDAFGPLLEATESYSGPGGQHPFQDSAGNWKMAFHAWDPGAVGYGAGGHRSMWLADLNLSTMTLS